LGEEKMKKGNLCFKIGFVVLMIGLLLTASACSKKAKVDTSDQYPQTQGPSEADLAAQRLAQEQQDALRMKEAARQAFENEDVYFNFDDATLTPEAIEVLNQKAAWLKENAGASVTVEGHCDERGTNEYNIALGERRAQSIVSFLANAGIGADQMKAVSYGEEKPAVVGNDEAAWAKNRRGHLVVN
jgi:peptidoglycan-associated lipoprotein